MVLPSPHPRALGPGPLHHQVAGPKGDSRQELPYTEDRGPPAPHPEHPAFTSSIPRDPNHGQEVITIEEDEDDPGEGLGGTNEALKKLGDGGNITVIKLDQVMLSVVTMPLK